MINNPKIKNPRVFIWLLFILILGLFAIIFIAVRSSPLLENSN